MVLAGNHLLCWAGVRICSETFPVGLPVSFRLHNLGKSCLRRLNTHFCLLGLGDNARTVDDRRERKWSLQGDSHSHLRLRPGRRAVSRDRGAGEKVELTLQTVPCQWRPNSRFLKKRVKRLSGKGQLHLGAITQIRRP